MRNELDIALSVHSYRKSKGKLDLYGIRGVIPKKVPRWKFTLEVRAYAKGVATGKTVGLSARQLKILLEAEFERQFSLSKTRELMYDKYYDLEHVLNQTLGQFWCTIWNGSPGETIVLFVDNTLNHLYTSKNCAMGKIGSTGEKQKERIEEDLAGIVAAEEELKVQRGRHRRTLMLKKPV